MAANVTNWAERHAGYVRVMCEPIDAKHRFLTRLRKRLRRLEGGGLTVRERVLADIGRMTRRVG